MFKSSLRRKKYFGKAAKHTMKALIVFIKNPIIGKAKTRLAATVGKAEALRIYKLLLGHTRQVTTEVEANRYLFYSFFVDEKDEWLAADYHKALQTDGDLGTKMSHSFQEVFEAGNSRVLIVGSDCAALTSDIINSAFEALSTKDFVIGPAADGGYYLLGMNHFEPSVFENITWSTAAVLPQTLEKIANLQKTYVLLPVLSDIDTEADWKKHKFLIKSNL